MTNVTERTSEPPRLHVRQRARELYRAREILWNLVRKELKVKYTASVLGAVWSLLNPVVFLAVFAFVTRIFKGGITDYPAFLLAGLLAWNLFSVSLSNGAQSVIANANLVKKVYFPREILPLGTVGVCLVDFVLQSTVLIVFFVVSGYGFQLNVVWLYPFAFVALLLITVAFTMFVAALNVRYRDVQHLIGLAVLVWFWMTPIVYPYAQVREKVGDWALLNPLTPIVITMQRAVWGNHILTIQTKSGPKKLPAVPDLSQWWYLRNLGIVMLVSVVLLFVAFRIFGRLEDNFAENI